MLELRVNVLHAVGGQLLMVGRVQVARGDDDVGIHVVGIFVCLSLIHI